jgi:hypothetical protein
VEITCSVLIEAQIRQRVQGLLCLRIAKRMIQDVGYRVIFAGRIRSHDGRSFPDGRQDTSNDQLEGLPRIPGVAVREAYCRVGRESRVMVC